MPNISHPTSTTDNWYNRKIPAPFEINRRKSIRYARNDIGASIRKIGLFNFLSVRANRNTPVRLLDISSRGVLIATNIQLSVNKKISLTIRFADFKEFEVPSKVVRKSGSRNHEYGIKFDHINEDLADHLLATQRRLSFT
jgi:hypothetical protein